MEMTMTTTQANPFTPSLNATELHLLTTIVAFQEANGYAPTFRNLLEISNFGTTLTLDQALNRLMNRRLISPDYNTQPIYPLPSAYRAIIRAEAPPPPKPKQEPSSKLAKAVDTLTTFSASVDMLLDDFIGFRLNPRDLDAQRIAALLYASKRRIIVHIENVDPMYQDEE
jgi:hypothetical protein